MTSKTILITGCSTGIGHACAHGMKARGWQVHATARRDEDIERLSAEGLIAHHLDYCDHGSIHACLDAVLATTGGTLTALFNNGAYGQMGAVEDVTTATMRDQFEANFFGWHELTRAVLPVMRNQGGGRIINCSSVLGIVSGKYRAPYAATKHAIEALCTSMRLENRQWNIHVSSIQPGPIDTAFLDTALSVIERTIDTQNSAHAADYETYLAWMKTGTNSSRFKLPPDAVLKKLVHACESARPQPIYSVTLVTHAVHILKRVLPTALLDKALARG